jgi:hypothetical protein
MQWAAHRGRTHARMRRGSHLGVWPGRVWAGADRAAKLILVKLQLRNLVPGALRKHLEAGGVQGRAQGDHAKRVRCPLVRDASRVLPQRDRPAAVRGDEAACCAGTLDASRGDAAAAPACMPSRRGLQALRSTAPLALC